MKISPIRPTLFPACLLACWMGSASSARAASYEYDVKNQMTNAIIEGGQRLAFTYDVSGNISSIHVTTASVPAQPAPNAPVSSSDGIVISWKPLAGAAVYDVWRSTSPVSPVLNVPPASLEKVGANIPQTMWKDSSVLPGTVYYYWVQGKNGAGAGSFSPMITATYTPAPRPDFAVAELRMTPPDPATGRTFTATARVVNQGTAPGKARYLSLWLDHPGAAAVGERGEARRVSVGTLKAGQSRTVKISGLRTPRAAGGYVLRAFADSANRTAESDEDNNQASLAYQAVAPYVDLEVVDVDAAPLWPLPGKRLTSYVTLLNRGNVASRSVKLGLWTNQAAEVVCGTPANRSKTVGALQPWKPRRQTVLGLAAPAPAGSYPMRAFIDSACAQAESIETNNQGTLEYWVYDPTPNLTATKIVLSPTLPRAGQAFSATVTIKNTGTGPGPVGRLGVYLDRADAPVPANAPDQSIDIPRVLAPGSSYTVKLAGLTAPAAGARTLWVLVDALDAAAELSEVDNARSRSYTVLP